jgi:hypothetical protein
MILLRGEVQCPIQSRNNYNLQIRNASLARYVPIVGLGGFFQLFIYPGYMIWDWDFQKKWKQQDHTKIRPTPLPPTWSCMIEPVQRLGRINGKLIRNNDKSLACCVLLE